MKETGQKKKIKTRSSQVNRDVRKTARKQNNLAIEAENAAGQRRIKW